MMGFCVAYAKHPCSLFRTVLGQAIANNSACQLFLNPLLTRRRVICEYQTMYFFRRAVLESALRSQLRYRIGKELRCKTYSDSFWLH